MCPNLVDILCSLQLHLRLFPGLCMGGKIKHAIILVAVSRCTWNNKMRKPCGLYIPILLQRVQQDKRPGKLMYFRISSRDQRFQTNIHIHQRCCISIVYDILKEVRVQINDSLIVMMIQSRSLIAFCYFGRIVANVSWKYKK